MGSRKYLRAALDLLQERGATIERITYGPHVKVRYSIGDRHCTVIVANSPSDQRAVHNMLADIRRSTRARPHEHGDRDAR